MVDLCLDYAQNFYFLVYDENTSGVAEEPEIGYLGNRKCQKNEFFTDR